MGLPILDQPSSEPILRFCHAIGMFSIDRARSSCKWRTEACAECYNVRPYRQYPEMRHQEPELEPAWQALTGQWLAKALSRKHLQTRKIRLMTRGEALGVPADIAKVIDLCRQNPGRLFWLPTRAWRNAEMRQLIERELFRIPNLRLHASIDRYNSADEIHSLLNTGWSTMWFDKANQAPPFIGSAPVMKCKKTWEHVTDVCCSCRGGCFSRQQHHIWLKYH